MQARMAETSNTQIQTRPGQKRPASAHIQQEHPAKRLKQDKSQKASQPTPPQPQSSQLQTGEPKIAGKKRRRQKAKTKQQEV